MFHLPVSIPTSDIKGRTFIGGINIQLACHKILFFVKWKPLQKFGRLQAYAIINENASSYKDWRAITLFL